MIERRRAQRVLVATVANVTVNGLQETVKVFVKDLSIVGMGCTSSHLFQKGDMLFVNIELISSTNEVITECLTGKVVRVSEHDTESNYTIGVEFRGVERLYPKYYAYVKDLEKVSH